MTDFRSTGPELDIPGDYFEPGNQRLAAWQAVQDARNYLLTTGTQLAEIHLADKTSLPPEETPAYLAAQQRLDEAQTHLARFTE